MCSFKRLAAFAAAMTMAAGVMVPASADNNAEKAAPAVELVSRDDVIRDGSYKKYDIVYSQQNAVNGVSFRLDMPKGMDLVDFQIKEDRLSSELGFDELSFSKKMEFKAHDIDGKTVDGSKTVKLGTVVVKTNGVEGDLKVKKVKEDTVKDYDKYLEECEAEGIISYFVAPEISFEDLDFCYTPDVSSAKKGDIITYDVDIINYADLNVFQSSLLFSDKLEYDHYVGEDNFSIPNDFEFDLSFAEDIDEEEFPDGHDYSFVGVYDFLKLWDIDEEAILDETVTDDEDLGDDDFDVDFSDVDVDTLKAGSHNICKLAFKATEDIDDTTGLIMNYYTLAHPSIKYAEDETVTDGEDVTGYDETQSFSRDLDAIIDAINEYNDNKADMLGDSNGSNTVDVSDVSAVAANVKGIKEIDEEFFENADVDEDGSITVTDLSKVAAHVKGVKSLAD